MTNENNSGRSSFKAALRSELVSAAGRRIERRKKVKKALATGVWVSVLAVGGTGLLVATEDRSAEAGVLTVKADGPDLLVNITDKTADPIEVRSALAASGIVARVEAVPVAPALVGKFVANSVQSDASVELVTGQDNASESFRVAKGSRTELQLSIGRPAQPGEKYYVTVNAYRQGNLLACSDLWGKTPQAAADYAVARGLQVQFDAPANASLLDGSPHGFVTDAAQLSSDTVTFTLSDTEASPLIQSEGPLQDGC